MGCTSSTVPVKVGDNFSNQSMVQEESQSFRYNVKAVRYAIKDPSVRFGFQVYLEGQKNGVEFLTCYVELEGIKSLRDEKLIPSTNVLLAKYQLLYEQGLRTSAFAAQHPGTGISTLWGKLGRLKKIDLNRISRTELMRAINDAQHQMLSELAVPFEEFLETSESKTRLQKRVTAVGRLPASPPRVSTPGQQRKLIPKAAGTDHSAGSPLRLFSSPTLTSASSSEFTNVFT